METRFFRVSRMLHLPIDRHWRAITIPLSCEWLRHRELLVRYPPFNERRHANISIRAAGLFGEPVFSNGIFRLRRSIADQSYSDLVIVVCSIFITSTSFNESPKAMTRWRIDCEFACNYGEFLYQIAQNAHSADKCINYPRHNDLCNVR